MLTESARQRMVETVLWLFLLVVAPLITEAQTPRRSPSRQVPSLTIAEKEWMRIDRSIPGWPPPKLIWKGEPLVHPRGIMLDIDANLLYVSDPGEPFKDSKRFPARIVTFSLIDGTPKNPKIFFSKPGFLFSAKWGIPVTIDGRKQILVADQGEPLDEYGFSGKGAKVFSIPVLADGTAGEPSILWQGKPFVCPTGIALVGNFIYITDPCAGPIRTRPDKPEVPFPSSAIFALRATGGEHPILIKSGAPFTSLIGICPLTPGEIIVNDTDSGRLDPTASGGRPGFAPPAGADRWVLKILDPYKPRLSEPVRTPFTEEGPVTLVLSNLPNSSPAHSAVRIRTRGHSWIVPTSSASDGTYLVSPPAPTQEVRVYLKELRGGRKIRLNVASDVMDDRVSLYASFSGSGWGAESAITVPKSQKRIPIILDNKHGGATGWTGGGGGFGGGGAGGSWRRFTTDNAPDHGAVYIYPNEGGTPVALAKGLPLERPISAQLSADAEKLWIMDQQNASMFEVPFCSVKCFEKLFPREIRRWQR